MHRSHFLNGFLLPFLESSLSSTDSIVIFLSRNLTSAARHSSRGAALPALGAISPGVASRWLPQEDPQQGAFLDQRWSPCSFRLLNLSLSCPPERPCPLLTLQLETGSGVGLMKTDLAAPSVLWDPSALPHARLPGGEGSLAP